MVLDNSLLLYYSLLIMEVKNLYVLPISQKGQITIPVDVRRLLGVKEQEKIVLQVFDDRVSFKPAKYSLEQVFGKVKPIKKSFSEIRKIAREERVKKNL
jgi:AbrB family looped-hinge helix DNA binding protein